MALLSSPIYLDSSLAAFNSLPGETFPGEAAVDLGAKMTVEVQIESLPDGQQ